MRHYPICRQLIQAHTEPEGHSGVNVLISQRAQRLYALEIARWLNVVRQINYLLQQRHIRPASGVPAYCAVHPICHAEEVPGQRRARDGVRELYVLTLERVKHYTIFFCQLQLLRQGKLFGDIVQYARLGRVAGVLAPALGQLYRLVLAAGDVRHTLGLEPILIHLLPEPVKLRLCAVVPRLDYTRVHLAVELVRALTGGEQLSHLRA